MQITRNFGIDAQAMAVFNMLLDRLTEELTNYDVRVDFAPWYNGRERAIVLWVGSRLGFEPEQITFVFGEQRSSDNIFVDTWKTVDARYSYHNVPNHGMNEYEAAYENRRSFGYGAAGKASVFIFEAIEKFAKSFKMKEMVGNNPCSEIPLPASQSSPGYMKDFFDATEDVSTKK